jgi:hypothetical protein
MQGNDFRQVGRNRYTFTWRAPWGQVVPAEVIVTTARGWAERPEARSPRWSAYPVGPAVVAIRLKRAMRLRPDVRGAGACSRLGRWR